jgi:hypothetical protein
VLHWFDDRIAAELRLWDAIDQHRLTPFAYYGIADALDLREIPWRRGRGYDERALTDVITATDVWARYVLKQFAEHFGDPPNVRALGFCVGVDHARYMARVFNQHGVPAVAVTGDTRDDERKQALKDLERGDVRVVFSVDLFNEGVDVPTVDALLMLRPTESPLLFLQQLGRGLRKVEGKAVCTKVDRPRNRNGIRARLRAPGCVAPPRNSDAMPASARLARSAHPRSRCSPDFGDGPPADFVGHHRQEFRYDRRFRALLGGTRTDVMRQVEQGFPFLPAGCHMELDRVASERVLSSIRNALPRTIAERAGELAELAAASERGDVTLKQFLDATGLDLDDVYAGNYSWSDLRDRAGLDRAAAGDHEPTLRRACGRLLHVDDPERLRAWRRWLQRDTPPDVADAGVSERDDRLLRMLLGQLLDQVAGRDMSLRDGAAMLWAHLQVRRELDELFEVLEDRVSHLTPDPGILPDVPLHVHARYTRIEILAACGVGVGARVMPWQTGVLYVEALPADLLAFTLDKTRGAFSPTTRYRDYAISRDLIHWESQSVTRTDSETGRRYQEHARRGSHVLLFARLNTGERAFHLLGPARYVRHESEQPMAITWKLEYRLPGDLYQAFAAAVA